MPPGHGFDETMMIDNKGCLTPKGPLGLAANETGLRLDIWIFQGSAACMAFLLNPAGATWEMHPEPPDDHFGDKFEPGGAVGMGLIVKEEEIEGGQKRRIVEQWTAAITLT